MASSLSALLASGHRRPSVRAEGAIIGGGGLVPLWEVLAYNAMRTRQAQRDYYGYGPPTLRIHGRVPARVPAAAFNSNMYREFGPFRKV